MSGPGPLVGPPATYAALFHCWKTKAQGKAAIKEGLVVFYLSYAPTVKGLFIIDSGRLVGKFDCAGKERYPAGIDAVHLLMARVTVVAKRSMIPRPNRGGINGSRVFVTRRELAHGTLTVGILDDRGEMGPPANAFVKALYGTKSRRPQAMAVPRNETFNLAARKWEGP